jgi:hypothetical protein
MDHTPGPWFVTTQDDYPTGEVSADPMGVRHVVTTYGNDAKANARLIAAAPDLLLALTWLVGLKDEPPPDYDEQNPLAWAAARAAIDKAFL